MDAILDIWPTLKALADDLGLPYSTVHSWSVRRRIPPDHDLDLIGAAAARGRTLTLEDLAVARRCRAGRPDQDGGRAA